MTEQDERPPAADELAFDVEELPGGARAAVEAVLMVADEPIPAVRLAAVLALPTERVEAILLELAAWTKRPTGQPDEVTHEPARAVDAPAPA